MFKSWHKKKNIEKHELLPVALLDAQQWRGQGPVDRVTHALTVTAQWRHQHLQGCGQNDTLRRCPRSNLQQLAQIGDVSLTLPTLLCFVSMFSSVPQWVSRCVSQTFTPLYATDTRTQARQSRCFVNAQWWFACTWVEAAIASCVAEVCWLIEIGTGVSLCLLPLCCSMGLFS